MKEDIREAWAERLESEQEKQGRARLAQIVLIGQSANGNRVEEERYCCLGVLCLMYIEQSGHDDIRVSHVTENGIHQLQVEFLDEEEFLDEDDQRWKAVKNESLPPSVMLWAGLTSSDPLLMVDPHTRTTSRASVLNDSEEMSFREIASCVRAGIEDGE